MHFSVFRWNLATHTQYYIRIILHLLFSHILHLSNTRGTIVVIYKRTA